MPELANAIHFQVFGGRMHFTPQGKGAVAVPVGIKLNQFDNIPRGRLDKMRLNKKNFLEVPIGSDDKRLAHLEPGIYQKKRIRTRAAGRRFINARARRRSGARNQTFLIMQVKYEPYRDVKPLIAHNEIIERTFNDRFFRDLRRRVFADQVFRQRRG